MSISRPRQPSRLHRTFFVAACIGVSASLPAPQTARAQEEPGDAPTAPDANLAATEARLADRYDRLEMLVGRLAELTRTAQPQRAALLQQMITRSREQDVAGKFDHIVDALENESYSTALEAQAQLEAELQGLLELLLQEDRDRQLESQRKRIMRYLQDVNRLIRLQRGVKARTEGGDDAPALAKDQQRVVDDTEKLEDEIEQAEASAGGENEKASQDSSEATPGSGPDANQEPPGEEDAPTEAEAADDRGKPSEGEGSPADEQQPSPQNENPDPADGEPSDNQEAAPEESEQPSESPSGSQPAQDPSGRSPQQGQSQSQGAPGEQSGEQASGQPPGEQAPSQEPNPMQRAAERLRQAQQRMEVAQKRLEEAKRENALDEQEKAVEELEQARAEFERILRQLREEELERMLVLLEARFRKMLEDQIKIYEETKSLEAAVGKAAEHEVEIASGRLARREEAIVREADRALVLLREDGTSTAFPEAVEQARDDMQSITERLRDVKLDIITQGLEEDVIAALEEALATLQSSLDELREQRSGQQQDQSGGEPGEQPLVDDLEELRMIRALQQRVNKRTQRYGALIEGEQASDADLIDALRELGIRQQKIFNATRDLGRKEN